MTARALIGIPLRHLLAFVLALLVGNLAGCGYNRLVSADENVKAAWSEVLNQYQRRNDLVPALVEVVKADAAFERSTLMQVVEARARATAVQATPALVDDPEAFARFERAQAQVGGALSRLLVVAENYPTLQANQAFRDLQAQLEGTENRIAVARHRYIEAVNTYNTEVRSLPSNMTAMAFGFHAKANFRTDDDAAVARPPHIDLAGALAPSAPASARP